MMGTSITMLTEAHPDLALLGLLQLVSPALPIGGFAWSQGLESALELGWVCDEHSLGDWVEGVLEDGPGHTELPVMVRLMEAWRQGDEMALAHWDRWLAACRETRELAEEERQLGASLKRLIDSLQLWPKQPSLPPGAGYTTAFSAVAVIRGIETRQALLGFAWNWLENQLAVACKAMPLGHTAAQRLVERMRPELIRCIDKALVLEDDQLGPALPGLALASAQHETQYSRLFRS